MKSQYVIPVKKYLKIKNNLYGNTYIRKNGVGVYIVNGKEIPAKEWEKTNELPNSLVLGRVNPSTKHQWIY
jgi:hypothetical protein